MQFTCEKCGWVIFADGEVGPCPRCKGTGSYTVKRPQWLRYVERFKTDADTGVGDTVQRIAARFGGEKFKAFAAKVGIPCGCSDRQSEWNRLFPYER